MLVQFLVLQLEHSFIKGLMPRGYHHDVKDTRIPVFTYKHHILRRLLTDVENDQVRKSLEAMGMGEQHSTYKVARFSQ